MRSKAIYNWLQESRQLRTETKKMFLAKFTFFTLTFLRDRKLFRLVVTFFARKRIKRICARGRAQSLNAWSLPFLSLDLIHSWRTKKRIYRSYVPRTIETHSPLMLVLFFSTRLRCPMSRMRFALFVAKTDRTSTLISDRYTKISQNLIHFVPSLLTLYRYRQLFV